VSKLAVIEALRSQIGNGVNDVSNGVNVLIRGGLPQRSINRGGMASRFPNYDCRESSFPPRIQNNF
jgi:hypothetical protein